LAVSASAYHGTQAISGTFYVIITARPGQKLDDLVAIADKEIERLKTDGPTDDEVAKSQTSTETGLILGLQSATRISDYLNQNNVFFGDPLAYKAEMKRLFAVTPEDVKRVANQYLVANRVRLDVEPGPASERAPEVEVDKTSQVAITPEAPAVKDSFDRGVMPKVTGNPEFTPPPVVRKKLSNGLEVVVAERHELPIMTLNLIVRGGGDVAPGGKEGLADLMADLMAEGTESRNAVELAGDLSEIGASLGAFGGLESSGMSLTTLTKHEEKALELFADVLLHPSFPENELERLRKQKLAAILRRADDPTGIAGVVFPKLLYGPDHPYGRIDTAKSVGAVTRDDVIAFYKQLFVPNNAALIVVGDVKIDEITARLESALKDWKAGEAPKAEREDVTSDRPVTVYLVDKPGAAQSVLAVGHVGVARSTPDYFPLSVMNAILGGQFSSRINLNLREDKGYTYGARSSFAFRQGAGPFEAGGSVKTDVTKEALVELVKEIRDITSERPATEAELAFAKDRLVKGFPSRFETVSAVASSLQDLVIYHLPDDYFTSYQSKIEAVTAEDVARVAKKYLKPDHQTILVVGDRKTVEPALNELPYAKVINVLDAEGNPLPPNPIKEAEEVK
jgi:zinc protease